VGNFGVDTSDSVANCCENGNEFSGSIKGTEFLDYLSDYWLPSKNSAPRIWLVS
jgi:hypothetical protein